MTSDQLSPMRVHREYRAIVTPENEILRYRGATCFEAVSTCPKCGYALPEAAKSDHWKFCPACGQAIVMKG